jgi:23S rRNA (cytidine1920-2'-O)/16S rRNA (cytidine1409-2'-O)-methyltransferase
VRRRLDSELVRRGLASSRAEAQAAVDAGIVTVGGRPAAKASTLVADSEPVELTGPPRRFVSRGGDKLEAALGRFGIDPSGLDCLDAGASTGGFTDCLLRHGAARVAAVDVGYGQLAWPLRRDPRVVVMERTNVRNLRPADLPFAPALVVADLSFIPLAVVIPSLATVAAPGARFVVLVKPQFEVGPERVGRGGVVRDPESWRLALEGVAAALAASGLRPEGAMASPVLGPAGNVEFLVAARATGAGDAAAAHDGAPEAEVDLEAAVTEGIAVRERRNGSDRRRSGSGGEPVAAAPEGSGESG